MKERGKLKVWNRAFLMMEWWCTWTTPQKSYKPLHGVCNWLMGLRLPTRHMLQDCQLGETPSLVGLLWWGRTDRQVDWLADWEYVKSTPVQSWELAVHFITTDHYRSSGGPAVGRPQTYSSGKTYNRGEDISKPLDFERPFIGLLFQTKEALSDNNLSVL